jgi:hypothetical protein
MMQVQCHKAASLRMSRTYFANELWCWAKQKNKDPIQENGHRGIKVFFAERGSNLASKSFNYFELISNHFKCRSQSITTINHNRNNQPQPSMELSCSFRKTLVKKCLPKCNVASSLAIVPCHDGTAKNTPHHTNASNILVHRPSLNLSFWRSLPGRQWIRIWRSSSSGGKE